MFWGEGTTKEARLVCSPWLSPPSAAAGDRARYHMDTGWDLIGYFSRCGGSLITNTGSVHGCLMRDLNQVQLVCHLSVRMIKAHNTSFCQNYTESSRKPDKNETALGTHLNKQVSSSQTSTASRDPPAIGRYWGSLYCLTAAGVWKWAIE